MKTAAHQIVETLLEGDDKPKKSMPDWLKKIKGIKDEDEGSDSEKSDKPEGDKSSSKEPKPDGGSDKGKGSGESVKHTW